MNTEQIAELVVQLAALATQALVAYHKAAGIPITAESVAALMPDMTPLTPADPVAGLEMLR